jgi:hypothetical protein
MIAMMMMVMIVILAKLGVLLQLLDQIVVIPVSVLAERFVTDQGHQDEVVGVVLLELLPDVLHPGHRRRVGWRERHRDVLGNLLQLWDEDVDADRYQQPDHDDRQRQDPDGAGQTRFALNFGALRDGDFVRVAGVVGRAAGVVGHADLSKQETCASRVLTCC